MSKQITRDSRLTKAEAAIQLANSQISAMQQGSDADPDTIAALQDISNAVDNILKVLRDWESKVR